MSDLSVFLAPLQGLLSWATTNRMHKDKQKDEALLAVNNALIESMKYAETQANGQPIDRNTEFELAKCWLDASTKVRHVSKELAGRFNDKSLYWSTPVKWSREEVFRKRIDFEAVQRELRQLLP